MKISENSIKHSISQYNFNIAVKSGVYQIVSEVSSTEFVVFYFKACLTEKVLQTVVINNL